MRRDTTFLAVTANFRPIERSMSRFHEHWDELRDFKVACHVCGL